MAYRFTYRPLAQALYDALIEDAFYIALEASVQGRASRRREAMLRYYDFSMREAEGYGELHFSEEPPTGASIWSRPVDTKQARRIAAEKEDFLREQMGQASLDTYRQIVTGMAQRSKAVVPPGSWYLSIVGVAPRYQGQGLGRRLIRPMLDRLDRNGCACYLETFTPRNMSFYRRMGFHEAGRFEAPGTHARYGLMIREPMPSARHRSAATQN